MAILRLTGGLDAGREVLGGKAWSIAHMLHLGIPVPPAFCLTTEECHRYYQAGGAIPADVLDALPAAMADLEAATGKTFGHGPLPLLVSVRSGAPSSMPGMMDTILNLGMSPQVEQALATATGDPAYAADTRRRFEEQYTHVVGAAPPGDPWEQLHGAIRAVFDSWNSRRAITYRRERGLGEDGGTAVTVQAMVFGNLSDTSGTGVLFTRDPLHGRPEPLGEWLPRGQGEDVVSGRQDPLHLKELKAAMPKVHEQLMQAAHLLERENRDMQDIEFTVEDGTLWLLQSRNAKRSPEAAVRIAVQLQAEGLITPAEALDHVAPDDIEAVLSPHIDPQARANASLVAKGKPACPGLATGVIVTDVDDAEDRALAGEDIILARPTTNPDDVHAMAVVKAILTEIGGSTSHAAVVSREMGVPCIVGTGTGTLTGLHGQPVTLDAKTGEIYAGTLPIHASSETADPDLAQLLAWARAETGHDTTDHHLPDLLRARRTATASAA